MTRDLRNVSREGRRFIRDILRIYVKDMINDNDYIRLEREILDVISAERHLVLRALRVSSSSGPPQEAK